MVGLWTYPWTLYEEGLRDACRSLADRGVDELAVASHHHSLRILQPRFPDALFERRRGGCYFAPGERFADAPIRPRQNEIEGTDDPLAEIVDAADDYGVRVNAWTVCLHNAWLGAENPTYRIEDCFGNPHEHSLCPSHSEVRRYFGDVAGAVADRGVGAVELESARLRSVFHSHDTVYGHGARQVLASDAEDRLFSQCFCEACRREARDHAVDFERARTVVRRLIRESLDDPRSEPLSPSDLVREEPVLDDLFEFRAAVVDSLLERVAEGAGDADLNVYVRQPGPDWPAGLTLASVERHADRLTDICYVSDPTVARERIRTLRRATELPVDAGVTLDPSVIGDPETLAAVVDAVRAETDGRVSVYNHAMLTEAQLDWVSRVAD